MAKFQVGVKEFVLNYFSLEQIKFTRSELERILNDPKTKADSKEHIKGYIEQVDELLEGKCKLEGVK
jgi:hypothetical protein